MSEQIGIVLLAVVCGLVAGVAVASRRRSAARADAAAAARMEARLEVQAAELRRLADTAAARDLAGEQLRAGRRGRPPRAAGAHRARAGTPRRRRRAAPGDPRLSTVLAGGASKGRAGEHVLRDHLSALPPTMLVTDFRVGGKVVEFGLLLSDGRRLPIDSKWTALAELEALEAAPDGVRARGLRPRRREGGGLRAKEVAQYLDPAVTAPGRGGRRARRRLRGAASRARRRVRVRRRHRAVLRRAAHRAVPLRARAALRRRRRRAGEPRRDRRACSTRSSRWSRTGSRARAR